VGRGQPRWRQRLAGRPTDIAVAQRLAVDEVVACGQRREPLAKQQLIHLLGRWVGGAAQGAGRRHDLHRLWRDIARRHDAPLEADVCDVETVPCTCPKR